MTAAIIQVYGTHWCPDTARARQCLNHLKIQYVFCDIETDAAGCALVEKVNHGQRKVPTIIFPDGSIMVEPETDQLEHKLAEAKLTGPG
jgi:mycoredoxin